MRRFICLLMICGLLSSPYTFVIAKEALIYRPIETGEHTRRVWEGPRCASDHSARLAVLAPPDTGLTTQAAPVLYWALSAPTELQLKLTILSTGPRAYLEPPLLETYIDPPAQPGIHPLPLAEYGVELVLHKEYEWFVTLEVDPLEPSADMVASATIKRLMATPALLAKLTAASAQQQAVIYAGAGFWYDALTSVSASIQDLPDNETLRIALLEQVGLPLVAALAKQSSETVTTQNPMSQSSCDAG